MKSLVSDIATMHAMSRCRLGNGTAQGLSMQGSDHGCRAGCMAHTVNLWGEGVIVTIIPSYNGGRRVMYRVRSDNGSDVIHEH